MKKVTFCFFLIIVVLAQAPCFSQENETIPLPPPQKQGGMSLMEALSLRRSQRSFSNKELSSQELSNLLWAAFGVNRTEGGRTAPSPHGWNEYDIYVIKADGWFIYEAKENALLKRGDKDLREFAGVQGFVKTAPVNLIYVADFDRMTNATEEQRNFYSAIDVGFISQNVYLYCASAGLSTVVRAQADKDKLREVLQLRPNQHPILAQTVGYPGN